MRDLAEILAGIAASGSVAQAECAARVINTYVTCRRHLHGAGDLTADDVLRIAEAVELNLKDLTPVTVTPTLSAGAQTVPTVDLDELAKALEQPAHGRVRARVRLVSPAPEPGRWRALADQPAYTNTRQ
jgi:hypothetical protein